MEKDTVSLSLSDYNHLRDFEREIEEGKIFATENRSWYFKREYISEIEALEKLGVENNSLREKIEKLKTTLDDVKGMNYLEFRKWCKS